MDTRRFDAGLAVPAVGLGCWQIGGTWGTTPANDADALAVLAAAYAAGTRFFDTADVYGDGRSERLLGIFRRDHPDITIATKLGRRGLYPAGYTREGLRTATERSLGHLGVDRIDLTQLHCVPTEMLRTGEVFAWLEEQRTEGLIARWGASVETIKEGLLCLEHPGCASLQVIFNVLRQRMADELFPRAREQDVAIIVRLPLASGLLAGKFTVDTRFTADDHRTFNRDGDSFNVGETFAGLPFATGVALVDELKLQLPHTGTMAQQSLRWILDHDAVTVVIPGASRPEQAMDNAAAADLPPFDDALHGRLRDWYQAKVDRHIRGAY